MVCLGMLSLIIFKSRWLGKDIRTGETSSFPFYPSSLQPLESTWDPMGAKDAVAQKWTEHWSAWVNQIQRGLLTGLRSPSDPYSPANRAAKSVDLTQRWMKVVACSGRTGKFFIQYFSRDQVKHGMTLEGTEDTTHSPSHAATSPIHGTSSFQCFQCEIFLWIMSPAVQLSCPIGDLAIRDKMFCVTMRRNSSGGGLLPGGTDIIFFLSICNFYSSHYGNKIALFWRAYWQAGQNGHSIEDLPQFYKREIEAAVPREHIQIHPGTSETWSHVATLAVLGVCPASGARCFSSAQDDLPEHLSSPRQACFHEQHSLSVACGSLSNLALTEHKCLCEDWLCPEVKT